MSESDLTLGRRWVRSVESESVAGLTELADAAAEEVYEMWFSDDFMEIAQPYTNNNYTLDDEAWQDFSQNVMARPYIQQLDRSEKRRVLSALNGPVSWVYTSELLTDGLWDEVLPTRTGRVDTLSRYVLSGAAGDALAESDPKLLKMAEQFSETSLDQRILIGGAAVHAYHVNYHRHSLGDAYYSTDDSGLLKWRTSIGGSIHGDFRSKRYARPVKNIADTTSSTARHPFMPALYESGAAAYHGAERGIVSGLLYHLVVNAGRDPEEVRDSLLELLKGKQARHHGAFADYGDNDGSIDARLLADRLKNKRGDDKLLYASIVDPGTPSRFELNAERDGVVLNVADSGHELQRMYIPNSEIDLYITTMITANGGRVSPAALLRVIDELK